MGFLSFLFGGNRIAKAIANGAIIVDVRTPAEYDRGRLPNSRHIPIERLEMQVGQLRLTGKAIVVCGSGDNRTARAVQMLKAGGVTEVYDGGNWQRVWKMIRN